MTNMLILMRHGKAQRPAEGQDDRERKLSEAGKRALVATLPQALVRIPADTPVQIWSSPAERAVQTARIMQKACKASGIGTDAEIVLVDSLWEQDCAAFMAEVEKYDAPIVLAVGHNPFIEDAVAQLTGSRIDFATGGFAAIDLTDDAAAAQMENAHPGRLAWFMQGPVSQRWKTLVQIERVLSDGADNVVARRDAFFADPDDPETAHKLRVSIRTLRSLIAFVEPWQRGAQNGAVQADLKAIVAQTSRLRELDVFAAQAAAMENASPEFPAYCAEKAAAERARVLEVLASKKMERRFDRVVEQLHDVKWRADARALGLGAGEVRARFDALAAALGAELEALDLADAEATHDVRKKAKQVRYDAERFRFLIGEDCVQIARDMVSHQDQLGAICDARVNIDLVDGLLAEQPPEPIAWDLTLLRAQNEMFLYTTLRDSR